MLSVIFIPWFQIDRDLRSMSLVCKSWTTRSQRALGKILVLKGKLYKFIRSLVA